MDLSHILFLVSILFLIIVSIILFNPFEDREVEN